MNILLTSTGFMEDRHFKTMPSGWQAQYHIVETMPFDRLMGYLKFGTGSQWAAVDAIVCKADTDPEGIAYYTLTRSLRLAEDFRALPESCAMRDGRKWKSIPFCIISDQPFYFGYPDQISRLGVTLIRPSPYPTQLLSPVKTAVDDYIKKVLADYKDLGLMVFFEKDRARIGPALRKKDPEQESAYYYAPADRRDNKRLMTVMRDSDGLRADVELFQQMLDMKVSEREMQRFFEDNPFFLTQARLGIQVPHLSYASKRWSPDFAFTSILGPTDVNNIELLELKGPAEKLLSAHKHHPVFTSKLTHAIGQVRDYGRYLGFPENQQKLLRQLGYVPTQSKLAVLIGRDPDRDEQMEALEQRRSEEPDIEVITYDKILATQAAQMSRIVIPDFDDSVLRIGGFGSSAFRL
jgi:hypothetical protein